MQINNKQKEDSTICFWASQFKDLFVYPHKSDTMIQIDKRNWQNLHFDILAETIGSHYHLVNIQSATLKSKCKIKNKGDPAQFVSEHPITKLRIT